MKAKYVHLLGCDERFEHIMAKKDVIESHKKDVFRKLEEVKAINQCEGCSYKKLCGMGCPGVTLRSKSLGEHYNDPIVCRVFNECFNTILKYSSWFAKEQLITMLEKI